MAEPSRQQAGAEGRARPDFGLLAEYSTTSALLEACQRLRDEGYTRFDAHTPFPVHGLSRAMGLRPSRLPFLVLAMGLGGAGSALLLQWFVHAHDYPLVISGKPFFSWPAFVPVMFEVAVLFGALGAVLGLLHLTRLPRHYHSLFRSRRFERVTDDRFFISVEASDARFDARATAALLQELGAVHIEMVKE